jgi:hypothetical protein
MWMVGCSAGAMMSYPTRRKGRLLSEDGDLVYTEPTHPIGILNRGKKNFTGGVHKGIG